MIANQNAEKDITNTLITLTTQRTAPRICPKCNEHLQEIELFDVLLDECPQCLGLWFDAGELDHIISSLDKHIRRIDADLWRYAEKANFSASSFDCPQCQTLMSELTFDASNVLLEFCINCSGVWLDRGEHRAIATFLKKRAHTFNKAEAKKRRNVCCAH